MFKKTSKIALFVTALAGAISGVNVHAADIARGEQLSQTCLGCHGNPGLRNPGPVYSIPLIGGQHADYIVSALKAYKSKERSHRTMQAQAANLSETDMADIGAYFAAIEGNTRPSYVNATDAAMGEKKSVECASCHAKTGDGDQPGFPKLAGQYESYIVQALKDYRSGERDNPIMKGFSANLTIAEIEALAAWFSSQDGGLSAPQTEIFK